MDSLLQAVGDFIARNHMWAGVLLGLVVFVESLAIVGAFVPATGLLVAAGGLIAAGVLDPVSVIVGCVIGAVIGDAVSYWAGRRLGVKFLQRPMFRPHRRRIAWTRLYCRRYGIMSIFVGRFFGPLRAFVPLTLGMLRMRQRAFQFGNATSAVVWVLAMLAPGYLAAQGLARMELLSEAHGPTLLLGAIVAAILIVAVAYRLIKARVSRRSALMRGALESR
ncbi:MAG: DedA family protein [Brevundimonas sp.]|jgi:membrane protein DedA with SNARE-associated domain|uniref:DedA family protein n=1 Tax=Brevundimonas sp. TaxID=1871086 RepID=UPI000DB15370|nr:DedA family protein [Brevundimonas sp.]PZT99920.1 MAG: DedA family protein [Brevundimonas sp.]